MSSFSLLWVCLHPIWGHFTQFRIFIISYGTHASIQTTTVCLLCDFVWPLSQHQVSSLNLEMNQSKTQHPIIDRETKKWKENDWFVDDCPQQLKNNLFKIRTQLTRRLVTNQQYKVTWIHQRDIPMSDRNDRPHIRMIGWIVIEHRSAMRGKGHTVYVTQTKFRWNKPVYSERRN
jgi:hypothetical protein